MLFFAPRRWTGWALLFAVSLLFVSSARAGEKEDALAEIQAHYNTYFTALNNRDAGSYLAIHTADYRMVTGKQTYTLDQIGQILPLLFSLNPIVKGNVTIQKFYFKGNRATAVSKGLVEITIHDPRGEMKPITVHSSGVQEDVWVKQDGGWFLKRSTDRGGAGGGFMSSGLTSNQRLSASQKAELKNSPDWLVNPDKYVKKAPAKAVKKKAVKKKTRR